MDKQEALHILKLMIDYDYGCPAFEEKRALKYAIKIIQQKGE